MKSPMQTLVTSRYSQVWSVEETVTEPSDILASDEDLSAQFIEQRAHELLSNHTHFRGRAGRFQYEYREEVLIVRGLVPSFYLKQVLQTALMELDGVSQIDNRVDVVSSHGLSSVTRNSMRPDE
jgi:hypothetical protein